MVELPDPSAGGIRRLTIELAAGGPNGSDARARLGWARDLGVRAASRPEERAEAAVRKAGLEITDAKKGQLDETLGRASRRPVTGVALREGGVIHLINADVALTPDIELAVVVHAIPCQAPAVRRLGDLAEGYTEDDWRDDPVLHHAMMRLTDGVEPPRDVRHARAWVLRHETPSIVQSSMVAEAAALGRLVEGPTPKVEMLHQPIRRDRPASPVRSSTDWFSVPTSPGGASTRWRTSSPLVLP